MLRLMIVDDEDMIRNAIAKMINFEELGYELIATAKNGIEAYDIICDSYPDVVLTDIRMPGLNGLELIERALQLDKSIDFVILSGYGEFELAKQAIQFGVKNFILKPTDKTELIETLVTIQDDRSKLKEKLVAQEMKILQNLCFPIQECFMIEAMESLQDLTLCYQKYARLLNLPDSGLEACICSYVEESSILALQKDLHQLITILELEVMFPIIAVNGSLVIIIKMNNLNVHALLKERIEDLEYSSQNVNFAVHFIHATSSYNLFENVFQKLARYSRINLLNDNGIKYQVRNNVTTPWKIKELSRDLSGCSSKTELQDLLNTVFLPSTPLTTCKNLAVALFIHFDDTKVESGIDLACHFFGRIYSCQSHQEIIQILLFTLVSRLSPDMQQELKSRDLIGLLKEYVKTHLDSQALSLKWIAENHLYVSVGYLSKQFVREEGIRFSDYLNRTRMEEAKKLLNLYQDVNIKTIAKQVGFGNNPHYFSQVFKKYTGLTPSEFIEIHHQFST